MNTLSLPARLNASQEATLATAVDELGKAALNTSPIDPDACRDAVERAYAFLELPAPELRFFASPLAAMAALRELGSGRAQPTDERTTGRTMGGIGALMSQFLGSIMPAPAGKLGSYGSEVDLSFNRELNEVLMSCACQAGWNTFVHQTDTRVDNLIHYAHAVDETLEALLEGSPEQWLVYSSGACNVWSGMLEIARVQALVALDLISAPAALAPARTVVQACGWINALEGLCLVCDRPATLSQEGSARGAEGLRSKIRWRDGSECVFVYHA